MFLLVHCQSVFYNVVSIIIEKRHSDQSSYNPHSTHTQHLTSSSDFPLLYDQGQNPPHIIHASYTSQPCLHLNSHPIPPSFSLLIQPHFSFSSKDSMPSQHTILISTIGPLCMLWLSPGMTSTHQAFLNNWNLTFHVLAQCPFHNGAFSKPWV